MSKKDELGPLEVDVRNGNVTKAYRSLMKMAGNEGIIFEMRRREFYKKPSTRRREKRERAEKRRRRKEEENS